jgi:hypothetical protein
VDFRDGDELWHGTLLVNSAGTRAWAVSYDDVYQRTQLLHSFGPGHPPKAPVTDIGISARKGTGKNSKTAYITVTWTSPMSRANNRHWWQLYATTGGIERAIGPGELTASGTETRTYPLPKGTTTFTVRYKDNEDWYPPGSASTSVTR